MINGIGIQFLDGIDGLDIQFLDGTDSGIHGVFDKMREKRAGKPISKIPHKKFSDLSPEQQTQLKERMANRKSPFRRKLTPKLGQIYDFYTQGYTRQVADNIDTVLKGLDFAGFEGNGSIEDDEMLLNHLVRTKYITEQAPQTIAGYQNPKMFNKMLGYVIDYWDTPDREAALDIAAKEEERLIGLGAIVMPDHEDEQYEFMQGGIEGNLYDIEEYEVNGLGAVRTKTGKRGFFNNIRKLNSNAALTEHARGVKNATQDAFLRKKIGKKRNGIAARRKKVTKHTATAVPDITPAGLAPEQPEEKIITQEIAETPEVIEGLGSTYDNEEQFNYVLQGYDFVGALGAVSTSEDDLQSMKEYFESTRDLVANSPTEYFDSPEETRMAVGALDYMTMNWDNPIARDKALGILAGENITDEQHEEFIAGLGGFGDLAGLGALDGKLFKKIKKAAKKVGSAVKKVAKKTTTAVKKVVKKTATAVKKVAKKTAKVVKKVAKKVGTAVKKVVKAVGKFIKKVVKFLIKFGPLSLLAKGGVLIACRTNMFKISERLYPGIFTEQEAVQMGFKREDWEKAKKAYDKTKKIYSDRLQGSEKKLRAAIEKGAKKKWKGGTEFNKAEMEAAANNMSAAEQAEAQAEIEADKQAMIAAGAQFDNNNTADTMSVQEYPNGISVDVPAPEETAVQGLQGLIANGYVTENNGLGFPPAIAAAATVVAAILGVISSIVGKKTAQIQANGQQPAQENGEIEYVDENGNPIPIDENGQPIYDNYDYSAEDQLILTQIATDPDALENPVIQAALASNPALANNPVVQTAAINKAATANTNTGMSTPVKIGIGVGGVLLLGAIAYFALSGKKEEVKQ